MAGYTRQAAANIAAGLTISAADHNAEYNQIQAAFDGTSGHTHTGGSGNGPKIPLTTSVSGILPVANGGSGVSTVFTAGSVVFSNGTTYAQDNAAFFWDNTNNYLGIGTSTPVSALHVHTGETFTRVHITNSGTGTTLADGLAIQLDATTGYVWIYENLPLLFGTNSTERVRINAGGNVSIGTTNNTYKLDVTGDANISGTYRVAGTALAASHLSNGVTGTGAVMLAASPTTTGTLNAAAITASGLMTSGSISTGAITAGAITGSGVATLGSISTGAIAGTTLNITGASALDSLSLVTDLSVANGGTGASTAAGAFANIVISASSVAADGYITLANGLKLQWGSESIAGVNTAAIVFPNAFASNIYAIYTTVQMASAGGTAITCGTTSETLSGFTANFSSVYTGLVFWFAIGV
jgi:hypothetical protein